MLIQGNSYSQEQIKKLVDFYNSTLNRSMFALAFLKERGISSSSIEKFKLGYSYGSVGASQFPELCNLDFFVKKGKKYFDRFSNRITFPVFFEGKVKFFTSRAVGQSELPHLHFYDSGKFFYNQDVLLKYRTVLIVESPIDAILLDQWNIPAMASLGANAQPRINHNIELLKGKQFYFCYDNDSNKSGIKGARQATKLLLEKNIKSKIIIIPKPEDTDKADIGDFLKTHSKEDMLALLDRAEPARKIIKHYKDQGKRRKNDFIDKDDVAIKGLRDIEKICCPFHGDSKPSLVIYHDTKSFYCFGCQRSGTLEELKRKIND